MIKLIFIPFDAIHRESATEDVSMVGKLSKAFDRLVECFGSNAVETAHENTKELVEGLAEHTVIYRIVV